MQLSKNLQYKTTTRLTISTPAYNSSGIPNISNKQTVSNKNGSGSSWSSISVLIIFRFQKFRVGMIICISCEEKTVWQEEKKVIVRIYQIRGHQARGSWCYVMGRKLQTYCRFGVRNEFWMCDQIAKQVLLDILSSTSTSMAWKFQKRKLRIHFLTFLANKEQYRV